jgi:hypothetical protein
MKSNFAVFANGTYIAPAVAWSEDEAIEMAVAECFGPDATHDGLVAFEVSEEELAEVEAWWASGAAAASVPACVEH